MTPNFVTPIERVISYVFDVASEVCSVLMKFFTSNGPLPIAVCVAVLVVVGVLLMKGSPVKGV